MTSEKKMQKETYLRPKNPFRLRDKKLAVNLVRRRKLMDVKNRKA